METINNHEKANDQKWSFRAQTYDEKRFNYFRYMQKRLISFVNLFENTNFLDLGCGTGWAVRYVFNLLKGKGTFIGIDISNGMIQKAKENAKGLNNIYFYKASSESLPIEDNYFDNIICTNSFHHYLNPVKALFEAYRVLNSNGMVYILDITSDDFFINLIDRIICKIEKEHVKFYSTFEYKNMFSQVGLKHIKSKIIIYPLKIHIAKKIAI